MDNKINVDIITDYETSEFYRNEDLQPFSRTGKIFESNNYGGFIILGKTKIRDGKFNYVIEFVNTGTQDIVNNGAIRKGNVRDCFKPIDNYCGGYVGRGLKRDPLYNRWAKMVRRCLDKTDKGYHNYGGRGITVCKDFMCFEVYSNYIQSLENYDINTLKDLQVDRIDNNGNYDYGNLRIVTRSQNGRNTRVNRIIELRYSNVLIFKGLMCELLEEYPFLNRSSLNNCLHGRREKYKGYIVSYVEN